MMAQRRPNTSDNYEDFEEEERNSIPFKKKFHHSLDSDEEDEEAKLEKYNFMDPNQFDGEEEGLSRKEGNIMVTAFNMREEMEDGHFDKEGTFIFKKNKDLIRFDQWVNDIDSVQIVDKSKIPKYNKEESSSDDEDEPSKEISNLRDILGLMKPGETVNATIRRLGKDIKDLRTKNRKEKSEEIAHNIKLETSKLDRVTSIADQMLIRGDVDIYDKTYEKINYSIQQAESTVIQKDDSRKNTPSENTSKEVLDIFSE